MNVRAFVYRKDQTKSRHPSVIPTTGNAHRRSGNFQSLSNTSLRALARATAQQGDYNGAIALLTQLIDRNPTSAIEYNNRGLIYFQSGQLAKAIADYNTALRLNPQLDSVYNNRANYYAAQGCLEEAIADYEMALDLNPTNIRAWINQGITYRQLGLYEQALDNFDFALHLGKFIGHIYAERGRTHHLQGDWNCAIADYRSALAHLSQSDSTGRLHLQVESWMNDLLNPLISQ